ncbi:MAG TPA: hypothetical protein PLK58_15365 [Candidatus Rifleibacterium sp.]|nr:hypothetical protein [Candidatus Rifleibacterium sp.]
MLRVKNSLSRSLQVILSSVFMVWMSWAYLLPDPANSFFAWLVMGFFFIAFAIGCYRLFDRRVKVILDDRGVCFPENISESILWAEISGFVVSKKQHSFKFYIVYKSGETRRFSFFVLDTPHLVIQKFADLAIERANIGTGERKSKKKIAAMGLADFVETGNDGVVGIGHPELTAKMPAAGKGKFIEVSAGLESARAGIASIEEEMSDLESRVEENLVSDSTEESELLDATVTSETYLKSPWIFPPWFSNDGVVNEMTWFCALFSGMTAFLFMASYLSDYLGGPPKIGVFEQMVVIVGAGPIGALAMYLRNFREYSRYSSYLPTHKSNKNPAGQNQGRVKTRKKRR